MVRELQPADRRAIKQLLEKTHQFTDEEKKCAVELVDIYFGQGDGPKDYEFLAAADGANSLCGFISFGSISLTEGCYDLYWIVCEPDLQNKGIGTKLLNRLEEMLKQRGGRKLFAETSSKADYMSARNFYIKRDFKLVAQIPDFYKQGDDKLVYEKDLLAPHSFQPSPMEEKDSLPALREAGLPSGRGEGVKGE